MGIYSKLETNFKFAFIVQKSIPPNPLHSKALKPVPLGESPVDVALNFALDCAVKHWFIEYRTVKLSFGAVDVIEFTGTTRKIFVQTNSAKKAPPP